jgi:hypothetical protein
MAKKNPAAVALGKRGGKASAAKRTPEKQQEISAKSSAARWKNHEYSENYMAKFQRERRAKLKREKALQALQKSNGD